MARTKQTARKSSGSKLPRDQHNVANLINPATGVLGEIISRGHQAQRDNEPLYNWDTALKLALNQTVADFERHPEVHRIYTEEYFPAATEKYGSMTQLLDYRLNWELNYLNSTKADNEFQKGISSNVYRITLNDWAYAVPNDVRHFIVWSKLQLIPESERNGPLKEHLQEKGIAGYSGWPEYRVKRVLKKSFEELKATPTSSSNEDSNIIVLSDSEDDEAPIQANGLVKASNGDEQEQTSQHELAKIPQDWTKDPRAGLHSFVCSKWPPEHFETIFFVNPVSLQTVPAIAHMHVFVKPKPGHDADGTHALTMTRPY